jgi:hypothetical protein
MSHGNRDPSLPDPALPEYSKYCKAYLLGQLRKYEQWREERHGWIDEEHPVGQPLSDELVVLVHDDFTVTTGIARNENVLYRDVTPQWESFCREQLEFSIPDDVRPLPEVEPAG